MKKTIIILFIILAAIPSQAQEDLSLIQAIKIGLENNYQIRIYRQEYKISENNDSWGAAGRLPVINAGINNINRYDDQPAQFTDGRSKGMTNTVTPNINLNWTIFDGLKIGLTKDNFELLRKMSKIDEINTLENSILNIITAYNKALLEKEKLSVFEEVLALSRDRYESMKLRKELGGAVTFELLQEKNAYLRDSTSYIAQIVSYANAIRDLKFYLGTDTDINYNLTGSLEHTTGDISINELREKMLNNNRNLTNLRTNIMRLDNNINIARGDYWPKLYLNSGIDYTNGRADLEGMAVNTYNSYDAYANLTLSFNIYNGGNTERTVENALYEKEIGRLRLEELAMSLNNSLKNLYDLYNLNRQIYQVALENKKSAKLNLEIAKDKFESGAINSFNFRDIQLIFINASIDELQAVYDLITTETQIQKLTGEIINRAE